MDTEKLANKIKDNFFNQFIEFKISIFLCGADINLKDKLRFKIAKELEDRWYSYLFDIVYPEDLFEDLLYFNKNNDLLSLENMLADSVDVILIVPESVGSCAELGAFSSNLNLRQKMLCVMDKQYKKKKSFISQGPVKLIKNTNKEGVIYIDTDNISSEIEKIIKSIKRIRKNNSSISSNKINLLQLDRFLLPTIYLLEPVKEDILVSIIKNIIEDQDKAEIATRTALGVLTKKKHIECSTNGYTLSTLGLKTFNNLRTLDSRTKQIQGDDLRLEILNLKLRNKKMNIQ